MCDPAHLQAEQNKNKTKTKTKLMNDVGMVQM
jgi:hypothetical protein